MNDTQILQQIKCLDHKRARRSLANQVRNNNIPEQQSCQEGGSEGSNTRTTHPRLTGKAPALAEVS